MAIGKLSVVMTPLFIDFDSYRVSIVQSENVACIIVQSRCYFVVTFIWAILSIIV